MLPVDPRGAKAQDPEFVAGALWVLFREEFDFHLVLAGTEFARQEGGLAVTPPGLIKPGFPHDGRLFVHANARLAHGPAEVPIHELDGWARYLEFNHTPGLVGLPVLSL